LGYHLGLLVCHPADHEDNNILRLVPSVSTSLKEGVLQFLETPFNEVLECGFEAGRMLRIDVLDAR
jgi:hypothetical protein